MRHPPWRDASAVRLCGPASDSAPDRGRVPALSLHPVDGVQRWFEDLQLSEGDRHRVVGTAPWLVRTFGDVRVEELMVPADPGRGHGLGLVPGGCDHQLS